MKKNYGLSPMERSRQQDTRLEQKHLDAIRGHLMQEKKEQQAKLPKESFNWLLTQKSSLLQTFKLRSSHVSEVASRIKLLDVGSAFSREAQGQEEQATDRIEEDDQQEYHRLTLRLNQQCMYVILDGKVSLEKVKVKQAYEGEPQFLVSKDIPIQELSDAMSPILDSGARVGTGAPELDGAPKYSPNEVATDIQESRDPQRRGSLRSQIQTSTLSLTHTPKPLDTKGLSPRSSDFLMSQYRVKLAFYESKTENKNSTFRRESSLVRKLKAQEYNIQKNYRQSTLTNVEKAQYVKDEELKLQLIETQFMNEFTMHSSPEFHAQVLKDSMLREHNSTVTKSDLHKDIVLAKYDEIRGEEIEQIQNTMQDSGESQVAHLQPGTLVNAASLIKSSGCLSNYQLVIDSLSPSDNPPVIGCLSRDSFKQALLSVDDSYVDKLLQFSEAMPGFKEMSRTCAKKVFYQFTRIKIHKGWQVMSNSMARMAARKDKADQDDSSSPQYKLYIILKGNFIYQSYKKNEPASIRPRFEAASTAQTSSGTAALQKFLKLRGTDNSFDVGKSQAMVHGPADRSLPHQPPPLVQSSSHQITNADRRIVQKQFQAGKHHSMFGQQKVKRVLLCQGQVFGEDECLKTIFRMDDYPPGLIQSQHYSVTCQSNEAEILVATIEDVVKHLKNEPRVVHFLKQEYIDKYPSDFPSNRHFSEIFSTVQSRVKPDNTETKFDGLSSSSESGQDRSPSIEAKGGASKEQSPARSSKTIDEGKKQKPSVMEQKTITYAIEKNFQKYGVEDKAKNLLLDRNETDFRTTIREIVEDYPFTKHQRNDLMQSRVNLSILENQKSRNYLTQYNQSFLKNHAETSMASRSMTKGDSKEHNPYSTFLNTETDKTYQRFNSENKIQMNQTAGFSNMKVMSSPSQQNITKLATSTSSTSYHVNRVYMNSKIDSVLHNTFVSESVHKNPSLLPTTSSQSTHLLPLLSSKTMQPLLPDLQVAGRGQPMANKSSSQAHLDRLRQMQNPSCKTMPLAQTALRAKSKQKYKKHFDEDKTYDQLQVEAFMRKLRIKKEKEEVQRMMGNIFERLKEKGKEIFVQKKEQLQRAKDEDRKRREGLRDQLIGVLKTGMLQQYDATLKVEKQKFQVNAFQENLLNKLKMQQQSQLQSKTKIQVLAGLRDTFVKKNQAQQIVLDQIDPNELSAISLYLEKESVDYLQDKVASFPTAISGLQNHFDQHGVKLTKRSKNTTQADDELRLTEDSLNKKKWSFVIGESEQFNSKTTCRHETIDLDDNQCMILNYYMLLTKQLIKEKNAKLRQLQAQRIEEDVALDSEEFKQRNLDLIKHYDEKIQEHRMVGEQLGIADEVDVIKEVLIRKTKDGKKTICRYHECLGWMEQLKKFRMDEDGTENPLVYNFRNWSYLGNQFLAENNFQLPSWRQVKRGIINEQIDIVRAEENAKMNDELKEKMKKDVSKRAGRKGNVDIDVQRRIKSILPLVAVKVQHWRARFSTIPFPEGDDSQPICESEFMNPYSGTNISIFYLYSLNTFIYSHLNRCARIGDYKAGKNLGPFAAALSKALEVAGRHRTMKVDRSMTKTFMVYRGLTLDTKQLGQVKKMLGDHINVRGYTSTSLREEVAVEFAMKYKDPDRHPVLYCINLRDGTMGGHCFLLNERCYTAYPEEEELLLDDGLPFKVLTVYEKRVDERILTVVELESRMPQRLRTGMQGTLQTKFDLIDFMENDFSLPTDSHGKPHYLCTFQGQTVDLVYGGKAPPQKNAKPTEKSDLEVGNFAAVTTDFGHADAFTMESVTTYPDEFDELGVKDLFLSHESFRVFNERKLRKQIVKDYLTQLTISSVKRYLTVQPRFLAKEPLSCKTKHALASLYPDERRESIWLFQQIKCDAAVAHYIVMLKTWIWARKDGPNRKNDMKELEEASFLAVKRMDSRDGENDELLKTQESSYVYLTRDRSRAAVWTWRELCNHHQEKMMEVPLSLLQHQLSSDQWVLFPSSEKVESILEFKGYLSLHFNIPSNTITFSPALDSDEPKEAGPAAQWHFCHFDGEKIEVIIEEVAARNDEQSVAPPQDKAPRPRRLKLDLHLNKEEFGHRGEMTVASDEKEKQGPAEGGYWFGKMGDRLLSVSRPEVKELAAIEKSRLLGELELRKEIKALLRERGIMMQDYLLIHEREDAEPKEDDDQPERHVKDFHHKCDGRATLVIIQGEEGQIFGGYTDIPWTSAGSVGKQTAWSNSFIFFRKNRELNKDEDRYQIYKTSGTNEVFHSMNFGPNFIDLKVKGPNGDSEIILDGSYQIHREDIDFNKSTIKGQRLFFKYKCMEVFATIQKPIEQ